MSQMDQTSEQRGPLAHGSLQVSPLALAATLSCPLDMMQLGGPSRDHRRMAFDSVIDRLTFEPRSSDTASEEL